MKTAKTVGNEIDPKFFNIVAQMAHFGMMFFLTMMLALFLGMVGVFIGPLCGLIYAVWHEFYWDPTHENRVTQGSDWEDFFFLVLGLIVAVLSYFFLVRK